MNITVTISPTLTREQQEDPRTKELLRQATALFNSPRYFTKKFCSLVCLHEAGHVVYARLATFRRKMIDFDEACRPLKINYPF